MKQEYNQYGDLIFSPEEQKQLEEFKNWYQAGWNYQSSDPYDEVQEQDFINSYIIYFKQKRDREFELKQEAKERQQNFLQKLVNKIINKGK